MMDSISLGAGAVAASSIPARPLAERALSPVDALNVTVSHQGEEYQISAEAQYLFEMQKYFHSLNAVEQEHALDYFLQSDDPLQSKVVEVFRQLQAFARNPVHVVRDEKAQEEARNLLNTGLVLDGTTEIGVRPNGLDVFRLDGRQDYYPARGPGSNPALTRELDTLEKATSGLRNRDAANLFGSVSNALAYSEHILLSADDVLHYNYAIEKARKTIEFVDAPEGLKVVLTDLLNQGIAWQNTQQNHAIADSRLLMSNSRVGSQAAEVVRMGSAAQAFNQTLHNLFASSNTSLLASAALIKKVIVEQPDLIRFSADRIDEALAYYRADDTEYEKALSRGFYLPETERKMSIFDHQDAMVDAGKEYALKVIKEIQGYAVNNRA